MANFKEIKNELQKLGLSSNQALIYLLLVTHKDLRIQEIVTLARIPRSSVYDNLKVLLKLGLIEKIIDDKFIRIKPYSIGSIRHGLNERLVDLQTQMSKLDSLDRAIALLPKNNSINSTTVRYYNGISGARQLLWNTLKTKNTIYVFSSWGRGRYVGIKFYKGFVSESRLRQIKEKVLVNPSERVLESIRKYAGTSIGRTEPKDIRGISESNILIKGETFVYDNIYAQVQLRDDEVNGFEIESESFTNMHRSIFETLWEMAKPLTQYKSQILDKPE